MEPLVSVIIPVYKVEKYLVGSVDSILNQTYKNLEIILVDDGSPDTCPQMCDEIAEKNENVRVIHKENGGISSARNAGIDEATGEYLFFLDSDDTVSPETISDLVEIAQRDNSDVVLPNKYIKIMEAKGETSLAYHFDEKMFNSDPKIFALNVLVRAGRAKKVTSVLYNAKMIKENQVRFPIGRITEDYCFNIDAMAVAEKISLYHKPSQFYLKRAGSLSTSYVKDFYDTIVAIDECTQSFIDRIDKEKYAKEIAGARETLLIRNILIYAINIMGDKSEKYSLRKKKCIEMFNTESFRKAIEGTDTLPYFEGRVRKLYMSFSAKLVRKKHYSLACFIAKIAARINSV